MKIYLLTLTAAISLTWGQLKAQTELAPNQNPNYAVSRAKYMGMSDSLIRWHSSTQQETYRAIDWLADRKEARADRREFRQQLRRERAASGYDYYDGFNNYNYYYPSYRSRWGNGYRYNNGYYRHRGGSFYASPWGVGYWWR